MPFRLSEARSQPAFSSLFAVTSSSLPSHLSQLHVWHDGTPHSPAENMAWDECLLRHRAPDAPPLLRFYGWDRPAASVGYFQPWSAAEAAGFVEPEISLVRRWTGGGLVDHRRDRTYSLIVPRRHPLAATPAPSVYAWVHRHLARALQATGLEVRFSEQVPTVPPLSKPPGERPEVPQPTQGQCFREPVPSDLLNARGDKLAGAAQRRTREGRLHQGSVQIGFPDDPEEVTWQAHFVAALSGEPSRAVLFSPSPELSSQVSELAAERYATATWNQRVR